jgi:hypothetical protein
MASDNSNIKELTYLYTIKMTFTLDGEESEIDSKSISNVYIDYNYVSATCPLMIVMCKIEKDTYYKMQQNHDKGKVVMAIKKVDTTNNTPVKYIKKEFSYYFPEITHNSTYPTDKTTDGTDTDSSMQYQQAYLGLLDLTAMNNNKQLINALYKGSNAISIIHQYTSGMTMIIEPFDYNNSMSLCYIPPLEGITSLLNYLNNVATFYSTGYRFFIDYNATYLLSNKPSGIDIKDNTYTTVQISVVDNEEEEMRYEVMGIDDDNKIYLIHVEDTQVEVSQNQTGEKRFSKVYGFSSQGGSSSASIDLHHEDGLAMSNPKVVRVPNNNFNYVTELKGLTESGADTVTATFTNVDNSILVPYKEFIMEFYKKMNKFNGKYILIGKKEMYKQDGDDGYFRCSTSITLQKSS